MMREQDGVSTASNTQVRKWAGSHIMMHRTDILFLKVDSPKPPLIELHDKYSVCHIY